MSDLSGRSDEELLASAVSDPDALGELYRRHVGKVTAFAVRRCRTAEEVHDLVAAVWLEALASADSFDPDRGEAVPWLLGIAANLSANDIRRRARERDALARLAGRRTLDEHDRAALERRLDAEAVADDARRAASGLPAGERAAFELVAFDGHSPAEAARILGIRPVTARNRLLRARRKMRRLVSDQTPAANSSVDVAREVQ